MEEVWGRPGLHHVPVDGPFRPPRGTSHFLLQGFHPDVALLHHAWRIYLWALPAGAPSKGCCPELCSPLAPCRYSKARGIRISRFVRAELELAEQWFLSAHSSARASQTDCLVTNVIGLSNYIAEYGVGGAEGHKGHLQRLAGGAGAFETKQPVPFLLSVASSYNQTACLFHQAERVLPAPEPSTDPLTCLPP